MNVKNRRSNAVTVPVISPASAIIHQKLWQRLRVEQHRGGGERESGGLPKRSRAARRARESSASLGAGRKRKKVKAEKGFRKGKRCQVPFPLRYLFPYLSPRVVQTWPFISVAGSAASLSRALGVRDNPINGMSGAVGAQGIAASRSGAEVTPHPARDGW